MSHDHNVWAHHNIISDGYELVDSGVVAELRAVADPQASPGADVAILLDNDIGTTRFCDSPDQYSSYCIAYAIGRYGLGRKMLCKHVVT